MKTTQTSNTLDRNNCTVMALKSVTGWQERKCQTILTKAGRHENHGFDIQGYIANNHGKIQDITFEVVYARYDHFAKTKVAMILAEQFGIKPYSKEWYQVDKMYEKENEVAKSLGFSMVDYSEKPMTLKQFAKENPKGVFYIIIKGHALAIINGTIVDNLVGKLAGENRQIFMAYRVTGNIKPSIGKLHVLDTKPKRHSKLKYGERVIYNGDPIKYNGQVLAKKGDLVAIETQQHNGLVVVVFSKKPTEYKSNPETPWLRIPLDGWSITCKIDRSLFETTKDRNANILQSINIIK